MTAGTELRVIMAQAIVRTAERSPYNRGPWILDEAKLQEQADDARRYLSELERKP